MMFPKQYKCLQQNEFVEGDYKLVPIRYEDRLDIMTWRNEQIYHLRQPTPLTPELQEIYFNQIVAPLFEQDQPNQLLFSYQKEDKTIGYGGLVHINWIERTAEVSFIIKTSLEKDEFEWHWSKYLNLLKRIGFGDLRFIALNTYAFDLRPNLYPILEKNGFVLKAHLKGEITINEKKVDVFIHECVNPVFFLTIRKVTDSDSKLIFNWSNDPLVRDQSFNSKSIDFDSHQKWFLEKSQNDNSLLLINSLGDNNLGLVRFEVENDKCIIGIVLDKKFRGKGFAPLMLRKSSAYYFKKFTPPIFAYIKKSNIASIRSFEKAGYNLFDEIEVDDYRTLVYKLEKV